MNGRSKIIGLFAISIYFQSAYSATTTPPTSAPVDLNCDFDAQNLCSYEELAWADLPWTVNSGPTGSDYTGPDNDHTKGDATGYYVYMEASNAIPGDKALLASPTLTTDSPYYCVSVWATMYGSKIATFTIYSAPPDDVNNTAVVFTLNGDQGKPWFEITAVVQTPTPKRLIFEAVRGDQYTADIAIDDITISNAPCGPYLTTTSPGPTTQPPATTAAPTTTPAPGVTTTWVPTTTPFRTDVSCDFDTDICGYEQVMTDAMDWTRTSGPTPTSGTGPPGDASGSPSGSYLFYESSDGAALTDTAVLATPPFIPTVGSTCMTLSYYMYGAAIGELTVYTAERNLDNQVEVYKIQGDQGQGWKTVTFSIGEAGLPIRVLFKATQGMGDTGDIAIDNILAPVACPVTTSAPTTTPAPTTPPPTTAPPTTVAQQSTVPTTQPATTPPAATVTTAAATTTVPAPTTTTAPAPATTTAPATTQPPTTTPPPQLPQTPNGIPFSCLRPSTPCQYLFGTCDPSTETCQCTSGAQGRRCQISPFAQLNGGECQTNNPCERGDCYDDGYRVVCECPDGYYGPTCANQMVQTACDGSRMIIHIHPPGFDQILWLFLRPPTVDGCPITTVPAFIQRRGLKNTNNLSGYAQEYSHTNASCAGDATVVSETATTITYSRQVQVFYGIGGAHSTDSVFDVVCEVPKSSTPPPMDLPPPQVTYDVKGQNGQPLTGPIRIGTNIRITFKLEPIPNSADVTDLRIESCRISDGQNRYVDVVSNGCARAPLGRYLYKPRTAETTLIMTAYWFPGPSPQLSFSCQVRTCTTSDTTCSQAPTCRNRDKRSARALLTGGHGSSPVQQNTNSLTITMPLVFDTQPQRRPTSGRRPSGRYSGGSSSMGD